MYNKLKEGLTDINGYDSIENEHIKPSYPDYTITRWVTLFGGEGTEIPHEKVLIYLTKNGKLFINDNAPQPIKDAFSQIGFC